MFTLPTLKDVPIHHKHSIVLDTTWKVDRGIKEFTFQLNEDQLVKLKRRDPPIYKLLLSLHAPTRLARNDPVSTEAFYLMFNMRRIVWSYYSSPIDLTDLVIQTTHAEQRLHFMPFWLLPYQTSWLTADVFTAELVEDTVQDTINKLASINEWITKALITRMLGESSEGISTSTFQIALTCPKEKCDESTKIMQTSTSRSSARQNICSQVKNCPAPPNRSPSPNIMSRLRSCPAPPKYSPSSILRVVDAPTPPKLSKSRMIIPIIGSDCSHLQCFDAESYLSLNKNNANPKCPVCNRQLDSGVLRINRWMQNVLNEVGDDCTAVTVNSDGNWSAVVLEDESSASFIDLCTPKPIRKPLVGFEPRFRSSFNEPVAVLPRSEHSPFRFPAVPVICGGMDNTINFDSPAPTSAISDVDDGLVASDTTTDCLLASFDMSLNLDSAEPDSANCHDLNISGSLHSFATSDTSDVEYDLMSIGTRTSNDVISSVDSRSCVSFNMGSAELGASSVGCNDVEGHGHGMTSNDVTSSVDMSSNLDYTEASTNASTSLVSNDINSDIDYDWAEPPTRESIVGAEARSRPTRAAKDKAIAKISKMAKKGTI